MSREAAERLYALGNQTVDQRRAGMAAEARKALRLIEQGLLKPGGAKARRWASQQLEACANHLCCPPPVELVDLIKLQLDVSGQKREGRRKNLKMWIAAIQFRAEHPDATAAMIVRGIDYDQKRVIAAWLKNPEFQELVRRQRVASSLP